MKFAELMLSKGGSLGRVMTSQAISTYANQVIAFVIPWLVLSRTGSAWNAGVTAFAMGLQQTFQNAAMFLGPVSAGLLIGMFTEGVTLLSASMLLLGCAFLVFSLKQQRSARHGDMTFQQARQDIWDAIEFIVQEPFLGPMQVLGPLCAFVLMPITTIIFTAWFVFAHQGPNVLGIFLGIQALGGMIGGVIFAALAPRVSQHGWLVGSTAGHAFTLASLYFLQPGSMLSFAAGFAAGVVTTGNMAVPYTAFYTRTSERLLGRVNSLGAASGFLMVSVSSLFFGWLVQIHSARIAILACALGMGLLSIGTLLLPFMKLLDEKRSPDAVKENDRKGG